MIRVACLGAGYFSQFHIDGWQRIPDVDLVGLADYDTQKTAQYGVAAFTKLEDMLARTQPDLLDIIIPPAGHADAIRTAISAGLTKIICQKPFCTSLEEAKSMVKLADQHGVTLIIHENFRFKPWYRAIKKSIDAGDIGTPLQATFRLRPGDGQGPNAYLDRQPYFQTMPRFLVHETGVHWIDTFRYLFGDPTAVYADLRTINPVIAGEDAGVILFDHLNGVRTVFDGNRCLDHDAENTRCTMGEGLFEGDQGSLVLTGDGAVNLRQFGGREQRLVSPPNNSPNFGGDCTFHLQTHVIEALTKDFPLENAAAEYVTVIQTELAIYESSESRRKVIISTECL